MQNTSLQRQKAESFRQLHHSGKPLLLPNIWESLGALVLEDLGYPAVATSSSAVALTHGFQDGENIPFEEHLDQLSKIARAVSIPVTADIEAGYAGEDDELLASHIGSIIDAGIAGINFEDSSRKTNLLIPIGDQVRKIGVIKKVAEQKGVPLFINARIDTYVHPGNLTHEEQLQESLKRGRAYKEAGADCLFPILIQDNDHIKKLIEKLQMPLNILFLAGLMDLNKLKDMGIVRFSFGFSFLSFAIGAMKKQANALKNLNGQDELAQTGIEHGYLQGLVAKALSN